MFIAILATKTGRRWCCPGSTARRGASFAEIAQGAGHRSERKFSRLPAALTSLTCSGER